jgi:hypothetical protein
MPQRQEKMKTTPERESTIEQIRLERLERRKWIFEMWIATGRQAKSGRQIANETGIPYHVVIRAISYFLKFESINEK